MDVRSSLLPHGRADDYRSLPRIFLTSETRAQSTHGQLNAYLFPLHSNLGTAVFYFVPSDFQHYVPRSMLIVL